MKKILCLIILLVIVLPVLAYTPEKTHVFQEGKLIRASQLNQNEDDFFNALTDGGARLIFKSVSTNSLSAPSFTYRTVQTINKFIAFNEFAQVSNNVSQYVYESSKGRGRLVVSGNDTIIAPLILPNGSTITILTPSADSFIIVTMNRVPSNNGTVSVVATCSGTTAQTNITTPIIDNAGYSYYLIGQSTSTNRYFQYVKVTYTTSTLKMD